MRRRGSAGLAWLAIVAVVLIVGSPWPATADTHCQVRGSRGWSTGNGTGTMIMKNDGKPCTSILYSVPEDRIPVDTIQVSRAPQNGTVTVSPPRYSYTPKEGFTGRDRFSLTAEGPGRTGRTRVKLAGEVTVEVSQ